MVTLAFTGHRGDKLGGIWLPSQGPDVVALLVDDLVRRALVSDGLTVISGMALGWDMLVAQAAVAASDFGAPVRVIGAVPFRGQDQRWPEASRRCWHALCDHLDEVVVVSDGGYSPATMQRRNEWMVDRCDRLVACWNGSPGGTANCVRYAEQVGKPVVNVYARYFGG
jgi:uncharacterized phage-like protein YoqJ